MPFRFLVEGNFGAYKTLFNRGQRLELKISAATFEIIEAPARYLGVQWYAISVILKGKRQSITSSENNNFESEIALQNRSTHAEYKTMK